MKKVKFYCTEHAPKQSRKILLNTGQVCCKCKQVATHCTGIHSV